MKIMIQLDTRQDIFYWSYYPESGRIPKWHKGKKILDATKEMFNSKVEFTVANACAL